ncbi:MAG: chemotaxis protein CheB [Pseudomonadota bacterium]
MVNKELAPDLSALRPGQDFDAVLIGASAGAAHALQGLMPQLRSREMAYIVVTHPASGSDSDLPQRFSALTPLPVKLAEEREAVLPGVVYFAPARRHLVVEHDGYFALSGDPLVNYSRPSIDVLFESAADTWGRRTVGIILTGANEDGARGLKAIGEAGGLTIVQDPEDADVPFMPTVAIRTAHPAAVLSLVSIARVLAAWADDAAARPLP